MAPACILCLRSGMGAFLHPSFRSEGRWDKKVAIASRADTIPVTTPPVLSLKCSVPSSALTLKGRRFDTTTSLCVPMVSLLCGTRCPLQWQLELARPHLWHRSPRRSHAQCEAERHSQSLIMIQAELAMIPASLKDAACFQDEPYDDKPNHCEQYLELCWESVFVPFLYMVLVCHCRSPDG